MKELHYAVLIRKVGNGYVIESRPDIPGGIMAVAFNRGEMMSPSDMEEMQRVLRTETFVATSWDEAQDIARRIMGEPVPLPDSIRKAFEEGGNQ